MDAVRVPPSAWSTSQSTMTWRSPNSSMSHTPRSERPMRRWISWVRPDGLPDWTSRRMRSDDAPGSIEYSAVTQPLPAAPHPAGHVSSIEAVHSTLVRPNAPGSNPTAWSVKSRSKVMGRSSSGARPSGRMGAVSHQGSELVDRSRRRRGRPGAPKAAAATCGRAPRGRLPGTRWVSTSRSTPAAAGHRTGLAGAEVQDVPSGSPSASVDRLAQGQVDVGRRSRRTTSPGRCRRSRPAQRPSRCRRHARRGSRRSGRCGRGRSAARRPRGRSRRPP